MEETTTGLFRILDGITNDKDAREYLSVHTKARTFSDFLNTYIAEHELEVSEIISKSTLAKSYAYEMLNGVKTAPGRDRVIALCLAARMDRKDVNRALSLSGNNPLSPKEERDCCIVICINTERYSIAEVDSFLVDHGMEPLETSAAKKQ